MGDREARDETCDFTEPASEEEKAKHEGEVVPAGQNMLDSELQIIRQTASDFALPNPSAMSAPLTTPNFENRVRPR